MPNHPNLRSNLRRVRVPAPRARRGGTSFVELALVLPALLAIVMGVIDFSWLGRNTLVIANAAREGARAAALGRTTDNIKERVRTAGAPTLQSALGVITNGSILMENGTVEPEILPATGTRVVYRAWPADITSGTTPKNGVPPNNYVRITVSYSHRSITGLFNRTVSIPVIMRREA